MFINFLHYWKEYTSHFSFTDNINHSIADIFLISVKRHSQQCTLYKRGEKVDYRVFGNEILPTEKKNLILSLCKKMASVSDCFIHYGEPIHSHAEQFPLNFSYVSYLRQISECRSQRNRERAIAAAATAWPLAVLITSLMKLMKRPPNLQGLWRWHCSELTVICGACW